MSKKNKIYTNFSDPKCPKCNEELDFITEGEWECPNLEECGYKEKNNLNICKGYEKVCGELIVSTSESFNLLSDNFCLICLNTQNLCIECGGKLIEIEPTILTCIDCGLVTSDDKDSRALHRMTLIRTKMDLAK